MSLICGIFSPAKPELASPDQLQAVMSPSRHRIVDESFSFVDPAAGIALAYGHSAAFGRALPEANWSESDDYVAAVAGDLYPDPRNPDRDLTVAQRAVRSFQSEPESFPNQVDGVFHLVLWDRQKQALHLAADKLNRRFLYYYHDPSRALTVFSSDLKGVLAHPALPRQLDERVLALFLTKGMTSAPFTLAKGVLKLVSAQRLTIDASGLHSQRYWRPQIEEGPHDFAYWTERFRAEIRDSVARQIGNAPKVAVNFSGGLDSSLVLAVARQLDSPPVRAFTLGFLGRPDHPDLEWSRRVAASIGVSPETVLVDEEKEVTPELLSDLLRQADEPFDSISRAVGDYYLCQAARHAGINSILTGGSPGGAIRHLRVHREADPLFDSLTTEEILRRAFQSPPYTVLDRLNRALVRPADMSLAGEVSTINLSLLQGLPADTVLMTERRLTSSTARDHLFSRTVPPLLGAEERTPFLDTRLAMLNVSIPTDFRGGLSRDLDRAPLKDAYRHYVGLDPDQRPKGAFPGTPQPRWLQKLILPSLQVLVEDGIMRASYLTWLGKGFKQGRRRAEQEAWRWFVFSSWYRFQIIGTDPLIGS